MDPSRPLTSDQILVREAIAAIPCQVKEMMSKLVLETVLTKHIEDDNGLLAAQESFIDRILNKVVRSLETIHQVAEPAINLSGFIASVAVLVRSEQQKHCAKRSKIEDRCR